MKELTKSASLWQEREYIIKGARRCEKINKKRQQIIKYNLLDEVLLRTPATSSAEDKKIAKMFDLYTGNFIISKIVDEHTYILIHPDTGEKRGMFHADLLKPYYRENDVNTLKTIGQNKCSTQ